MRRSRIHGLMLLVFAGFVLLVTRQVQPQGAAAKKISEFAPAADLLQQVDFFIGRVQESLADPNDYDLAKQARTLKDGNTLAALGFVLALDDEEHALKTSAAALVAGAQQLVAAEDNHRLAQAALDAIKRARAGKGEAGAAVKEAPVASLAVLMKQVPLIHSGLKRGLEPTRFSRQAAQSAGQAAALAAIAHESMFDTEHVKSPAEVEKWQACCVQMRDAAGEVNSAVHAADQGRVAESMRRLQRSCDACHASFQHR